MKKLLDVLAERGIGDRDAGHETLAGSAFDRTTEARCARVARLTEHGIDPREELRRLERLGDVIGGPTRETTDLVHDLAACRQKDHRDRRGRRVALYPETDAVAVGGPQHHVEEHQIRPELPDQLAAPPAVLRR